MRSDVLNKNSNAYDGKTRATTIFDWNYINCAPPIVSNLGVSGHGVMAEGDKYSIIFPGASGQLFPAACCNIGAYTATAVSPGTVGGTVPSVDTASTAAGLDLRTDAQTGDNVGVEMVLGGSQFGSPGNRITVGTHSATFDCTMFSADYSDFDCAVVGFRKVQEFAPGHGDIVAAASGDPLYTDYCAYGVASADDIQMSSDKNDASATQHIDSTEATADSQNLRLFINITDAGVVTFKHIKNAIMGEGVLAAPTTTMSFTFDDGDIIVPYLFVQGVNQDSGHFIKEMKVTRSPALEGFSAA
jgi:hypothetical protein